MKNPSQSLEYLWRSRPRNIVIRGLFVLLGILFLGAILYELRELAQLFTAERAENVSRFVQELIPYPLRNLPTQTPAGWSETISILGDWSGELLRGGGLTALAVTFLVAVAASSLAGVSALAIAPLASKNLATSSPYSFHQNRGLSGSLNLTDKLASLSWRVVRLAVTLSLSLARALPEVLLAFLLVAILGLGPWAAVLALFIHNWGILGRLSAEGIDHIKPALAQNARAIGQSRAQTYMSTLLPRFWGRFFVYFFYRWETCIREATVLGFVGVASLGLLIRDSRARDRYDDMIFYVICAASLVLLGDWVSNRVRRHLIQN